MMKIPRIMSAPIDEDKLTDMQFSANRTLNRPGSTDAHLRALDVLECLREIEYWRAHAEDIAEDHKRLKEIHAESLRIMRSVLSHALDGISGLDCIAERRIGDRR